MDNTIDAVRLALGLHTLRAQAAAANVAGAGRPDAIAQRYDFAGVEAALREAAHASDGVEQARWLQAAGATLHDLRPTQDGEIRLDAEMAEIAAASMDYQSLTEAIGRHFGLMRIAIAGRV